MRFGKLIILIAGFFFGGIAFAQKAPVPSTSPTPPPRFLYRYGRTLTIACTPVQTLDPQFARDISSRNIIANIQEGLYGYDKKGRLIPVLASAEPFMENEVSYLIPLKVGIKFHDGTDFDAKDVKYTFDRIRNHKTKSPYRNRFDRIKSIDVTDTHTVRVRLNTPDTSFATLFTQIELYPLSRESVKRYGENYGKVSAVGTGPFRFSSWKKKGKIVLKKNYEYRLENFPYIHKLVFKPFADEKERLEALQKREVSVVLDLSHYLLAELPEETDIIIKSRPGNLISQIYLNRQIPPFKHKKVRQALSLGIDREKLVNEVFLGKAEVPQGIFPSWHPSFVKQAFPYRPEEAKKLLNEAGFNQNHPLKFELLCTNNRIFEDQADWIKNNLDPLGIKVNISALKKDVLFDFVYGRRGRNRRRFKAALEDWLGGWDPKRYTSELYFSRSIYNKSGLRSSLLDQYFTDVFTSNTKTTRKIWNRNISRFLAEDASSIILCFPHHIYAYNPYVKRLRMSPLGIIRFTSAWTER